MFLDILHSIKYNVKFFRIQCIKHKWLFKSLFQCRFLLGCLLVTGRNKLLFLIPVSESFSANRCSRSSLLVNLDDLRQVFDVVIIFGTFWVVFRASIIVLSRILHSKYIKSRKNNGKKVRTPPFECLSLWTSCLKKSNSFLSFSLTNKERRRLK